MAVEFGVLLPTREAVMSGHPETAPMLSMAERAEAAGFDSVWIGDSLTARPRHEPLILLAAVAARTGRARLGTGVLETYYAAPARGILARQATYAGPIEGCGEWLQRWIDGGARHLVLRFAGGDQLAQMAQAARLLPRLKRG